MTFIFSLLAKRRKIRFEDDGTRDPEETEKDTRLKYKAIVYQEKAVQRNKDRPNKADKKLSDG